MKPTEPIRIRVVDSHTAGEPTRVLLAGNHVPVGNTMAEKRESFARDLDWLRTATIAEPRGHEAMVGALLCEPVARDCVAGVIFFNNVGVLNGCLHGTMGVAVTLVHQGIIGPGTHDLETPTGVVRVWVTSAGRVSVRNVRSYRYRSNVAVPGVGEVKGDIAWGGNWFFLTEPPNGVAVDFANLEALGAFAQTVRQHLAQSGITGDDGAEIDHIELFGSPAAPLIADSKNFVLCPGNEYDRSPCGTGTSAKLACLHADGRLAEGTTWRQAGILNTVFEGTVETAPDGGVYPTVSGDAYITAEAELLINPAEPFAFGISRAGLSHSDTHIQDKKP